MAKELRGELMDIAAAIPEGSNVLDLGCGDGDLLAWLRNERNCRVRGIELDQEHVIEAVANGVPVIQSDLDEGLWMILDRSVDYVVLSQALQEVRRPAALLSEMLRVADHAIVSFPNFANWHDRTYLMFKGRMPVSEHIPYSWHETPSIHHTTIPDFIELVDQVGGKVEHLVHLRSSHSRQSKLVGFWPTWRAGSVIAIIGHADDDAADGA